MDDDDDGDNDDRERRVSRYSRRRDFDFVDEMLRCSM